MKHLAAYFGNQRALHSIGLRDAELFISHLQQKAKKGYRVYYRTLKAAFNKAVDWGYLKENYFVKVKLAKKQKLCPEYVSSYELSVICEQLKNETVKDAVVAGFHTGMRLNEIVSLRWKNVDFEKREITVGDAEFTTKGRSQRFIPMGEEVFELLVRKFNQVQQVYKVSQVSKVNPVSKIRDISEVSQVGKKFVKLESLSSEKSKAMVYNLPIHDKHLRAEYVFCKDNGFRISKDYVSKMFKKACRAAGVSEGIHFHSLRHSFASRLVQQGVPLYTVKELLGHSSIATTEIYSHLDMETLREAVRRLDEA